MSLNILAITVFILCIYFNYKRGFVKSALGFLSFFLAFVVVASFGGGVTEALRESDTGRIVESKIYNMTYEQLYSSSATDSVEAIKELPLPGFIKDEAIEACENFTIDVYDSVSSTISGKVFGIVCHVVFFLVLVLAFGLLKLVVPQIFKLPVLKQLDSVLGIVLGVVNGFLWVYVLMLAVSVIVNIGSWQAINEIAQDSVVYNLVYENNILLKLFS